MKKSLTLLAILAVAALASSCDSDSNSEQYTYQLELNGCDTGKHTFNSLQEMCNGLKSRSLNNDGCAYSLREDRFKSAGCSGDFSETS